MSDNIIKAYEKMGICPEAAALGQKVNELLKDRFDEIDKRAEINQLKVLSAMQESKVSEGCLYPSTGYGYNDLVVKLLRWSMLKHFIQRMHL